MKFFPEYLFKREITSFYHRYSFLRYFPQSSLFNKFKSFYYNCNNKYYNVIFGGSNIKFCSWPYGESLPIKGYLNEFPIKNGQIVIDGGAYQGVFTLIASQLVGDEGKVVAFEPDKENYEKLLENIKLNNIKNVITLKRGLWKEDTFLEFNNTHNDSSSFICDKNSVNTIEVAVVSLDEELKRLNLNKIDFIKLDVEGSELEVIEGSENLLKKNNVNLAIGSYHVINGEKTCYKLEKMLRKLGYKTKTSFPQHLTTYACKE
ncbi:FkbM family methyltransferase [Methanobacterium sp.]|uniref:FkbM family methyltransferase n=1 Tax=Methanobacterium sp. TaxID=2164 RepID=UPI002ABCF0B8|nr:FkbM family methyltransferase [Methanobacterium sp.]MDY9922943.1 FkbM family methyltransferase [Methanobacterium sp.]